MGMDKEQSLGQKIKQARQEQDLTLEEVSHATRIKEHYLKAIEEDDLDALPSPVQQRGFVRSYASYLGLEQQPLLDQLPSRSPDQESQTKAPSPPPAPREEERPEADFQDIGQSIREQRETLGFSIADVENQIHIPHRYLVAIEEGRMDDLPSMVQGRGMLKNYAEFLGMDEDDVLLQFADILQARLRAKEKPSQSRGFPLSIPLWLRRLFTGNVVLSVVLILILGAAMMWSGMQVFGTGGRGGQGTPTIPGVAQVLLPSSTFTVTPTLTATPPGEEVGGTPAITAGTPPATITRQVQPTQPAAGSGQVNVQLIVNQRAYLQVLVDGEEEFNGRVLPGSVHVFDGQERVELITGNAAGIEVIFNQQDLGVLGLFGEVVNRVYTAEGIATPTPTISPTPTITLTPTITPTPDVTVTSTPTPEAVGE